MNSLGRKTAVLLAGLFIGAQSVLPWIHDLQVSGDEAVAHGGFRLDGAGLLPPRGEDHSHHDPSSCALGRFLAEGRRFLAPHGAGQPGPASVRFLGVFQPVAHAVRLLPGAASSRAPPAFPPQPL